MSLYNKIKAAEELYPYEKEKFAEAINIEFERAGITEDTPSFEYQVEEIYKEASWDKKWFPTFCKHDPEYNAKAEKIENILGGHIGFKTQPVKKRMSFPHFIMYSVGVAASFAATWFALPACVAFMEVLSVEAGLSTEYKMKKRAKKVDETVIKYLGK